MKQDVAITSAIDGGDGEGEEKKKDEVVSDVDMICVTLKK